MLCLVFLSPIYLQTSRQLAVQHKEYEKAREKKKTASRQKFQQMKSKWGENETLVRLTVRLRFFSNH
jgi:hypothetical protein